ncbi:MAG: hypothetical protein ACHQ4F_11105 [Candidatus Dormibacteria bacterium]
MVVVTACADYASASGGEIAWTGADSADQFTIFAGGIPNTNTNIVVSPVTPNGTYGPLEGGYYAYQFVDNTDEIFDGSFTILTCAVPNAYTDTFPHA